MTIYTHITNTSFLEGTTRIDDFISIKLTNLNQSSLADI